LLICTLARTNAVFSRSSRRCAHASPSGHAKSAHR
jgi:hypothetical protein